MGFSTAFAGINDPAKFGDSGVRLFSFYWNDIKTAYDIYGGGDLQPSYTQFDYAFVSQFPKILYSNPTTGYSNAGLGITSQLRGTAETTWTDDMIRAGIVAGANAAGFVGNASNLVIDSKSLDQIQSGSLLSQTPSTVNPLVTTDGVNKLLGSNPIQAFTDTLKTLSTTGTVIAFGVSIWFLRSLFNKGKR